jgi:hypothetical protein
VTAHSSWAKSMARWGWPAAVSSSGPRPAPTSLPVATNLPLRRVHRHPTRAPIEPGVTVVASRAIGPVVLAIPCRIIYRTDEADRGVLHASGHSDARGCSDCPQDPVCGDERLPKGDRAVRSSRHLTR